MNMNNIPLTTAASSSSSSSTQNNSIDKLTISYLKGEISFQQYENLIENQHFQADLVRSRLNETNSLPTEVVTTTPTKNSSSKRKHSTNSVSSSDEKRSKIKDRFLNLKEILGEDIIINDDEDDDDDDDDDDVDDEDDDDEEESTQGEDTNMKDEENIKQKNQIKQKKANKLMEEFIDETSNWTDFDIETLNFDKFIKDHQTSFSSPTKGSSNKMGNIKRKRGGDDEQNSAQSQSPGGTTSDLMGELKAKRRRNRVLPIEIQGLMGEANLNYARGETNKAIDTCLEVIKYAPKASEPYQLLSLLYSEMGQNDKALRVGLIAAQLNKDADEWIGLIQQAVIEGDVELVLFCYNNAIQCNPKHIQLHVERIRLLKERKDTKRLFLARLMLLRYVDINTSLNVYNEHFEQIMSELDNETDKQKKIYVLKNDMKKFQENFSVEKLIMLVKLMLELKFYQESIMIMLKHSKIIAKPTSSSSLTQILTNQSILNQLESGVFFQELLNYEFDVPNDKESHSYIIALFSACLIHLDYKREESLISCLYNKDVEENSAEFLLLADTYYQKKNYFNAKRFYHLLLTQVKEFLVQLDIWLKYGNCCNHLDEIDEAINAYRNAVNLDDSNCEAALSLVNILKKNSLMLEEATNVIRNTLSHHTTENKKLNTEILNLMINECFIQYECQKYPHFISNAINLLFGMLNFVLESENINNLIRVDSKAQRAIVFHQMLEENNFESEFSYNKLSVHIQNTIFDIYLKLCKALVHLKRYDDLLTYSVAATVLPLVYERMDWNKSINFTCLISCILKHDGKNAFNILKDFILEYKNSNKLWSYVGIVIGLCPSLSQQKYFIRLSAKHMDHLPLCLINAHFAIMSGTYRYALVEYMNCFKQSPYDPFINLIISITYCHISCQKYNTKRHLLVSQSLVFLRRYIKFRGVCQETYYNVARVMHQLSLFDLAAYYYQKCLELPCLFPEQKEVYDLKRFAAYNLISIYKHSNSHELARFVMMKHLTI